ncbi:MAG: DUF3352 domain-containing protein [Synechococcales cyanobacterium]
MARHIGSGLALVTSALVVTGCQLPGRHSQSGIPEAALIPASSPVVVSWRTDLDQLAQQAPVQQSAWQAQVNLLKAGLQASGIDYSRDLQPWIGETASLALVKRLPEQPDIPGMLLITTSRDPQKSRAFLKRRHDQVPGSLTDIPGGKLFQQQGEQPGRTLVSAEINHQGQHFVALANDPTVMQEVVAIVTEGRTHPTLKSQAPFQALTLAQMDAQTLVSMHVNVPALIDLTGALDMFRDAELDSPMLRGHLEGMQAFSFRTHWTNDGLGVHYRTLVDPNNPWMKTQITPTKGTLLKRLPADAVAVVTSAYPARLWEETVAKLEQLPEGKQMISGLQGAVQLVAGLDLQQDVVSWMDGEVAVAVVRDPQGQLQGFEGLVAIETTQREKGEATWGQLDNLVKDFGVSVKTAASGAVTWDVGGLMPSLQRLWVDPYLVLTSSDRLASEFQSQSTPRLDRSPALASVIQALPSPNYGYILIEGSLVREALATSDVDWTPEAQQLWESLVAVGGTAYKIDNSTYGADLRVRLKD